MEETIKIIKREIEYKKDQIKRYNRCMDQLIVGLTEYQNLKKECEVSIKDSEMALKVLEKSIGDRAQVGQESS